MSAKEKINLLPKDSFETSTLGKFFKWAISVGRWIVVITEFIVICAFLSRFYFDTQLANLFDEVKQKQVMVDSALPFVDNFKTIQDKIKLIQNILAQEKKPSNFFIDISTIIPLDVYLNEMSIDGNDLSITGIALSESGLNTFVKGLSSHPQLSQVNLNRISENNTVALGLDFTMSANIKIIK